MKTTNTPTVRLCQRRVGGTRCRFIKGHLNECQPRLGPPKGKRRTVAEADRETAQLRRERDEARAENYSIRVRATLAHEAVYRAMKASPDEAHRALQDEGYVHNAVHGIFKGPDGTAAYPVDEAMRLHVEALEARSLRAEKDRDNAQACHTLAFDHATEEHLRRCEADDDLVRLREKVAAMLDELSFRPLAEGDVSDTSALEALRAHLAMLDARPARPMPTYDPDNPNPPLPPRELLLREGSKLVGELIQTLPRCMGGDADKTDENGDPEGCDELAAYMDGVDMFVCEKHANLDEDGDSLEFEPIGWEDEARAAEAWRLKVIHLPILRTGG